MSSNEWEVKAREDNASVVNIREENILDRIKMKEIKNLISFLSRFLVKFI